MIGLSLTRSAFCVLALTVAGAGSTADPDQMFPPLSPDATRVWGQYLQLTRQRIDGELASAKGFLALDNRPSGAVDRQNVIAGQMPIVEVTTLWPNGTHINVPDNWVHHWRGTILLRGARLDDVLKRLQETVPGTGQGDVIQSAIRGRDGSNIRTYMQVQRSGSVLSVPYRLVYNTDHYVTFARPAPGRAISTTVATRIAELYHPGTPEEREMRAGEDGGYLRRWNSYWRYEEIGAGVIAECESVTLSRSAPFLLGALGVRSIAEGAARESMTRALINLQAFVRTPPGSLPVR
jgi:hypothetical protein